MRFDELQQVNLTPSGMLFDTQVEPQSLESIVDAYNSDNHLFFVLTLASGCLLSLLLLTLLYLTVKIPTNDFFVLKGSIYLMLALTVRSGTCFWLYSVWRDHKFQDKLFEKPQVFGAVATELALEMPLYFTFMMMFSLLFSTYKLYLVIQEMLGLSSATEDEDDTAQENEESGGISLRFLEKGASLFRRSFKDSRSITFISYGIDFMFLTCMAIKFSSVYISA
jgi:hypothetical protein